MQKIKTGQGNIPLISLIAIWSISLVVNLPGLAISPLLASLEKIFPKAGTLEVQLLTILPNFFIIPFILLSGKLSVYKNKELLVFTGLLLYLICGIIYLFAQNITTLIILSCLLGIACGIVIPLAAGLITDTFTGVYRTKQLGIKSGIANLSLVAATLLVGWLGKIDWHLPFAVYMIPVIPLILTPFLKHRTSESKRIITNAIKNSENINGNSANPLNKKLQKNLLWEQIILYFLLTFSAITITYYLPFLMQDNKMGTTQVGIATSVFFLFITIPGFSLTFLVKILGRSIKPISISMIIIGLSLIAAFNNLYIFIIASALTGMGYGIMQPLIYDATSLLATKKNLQTLYLSYIFTANYIAVATAPFIIDFFKSLLHTDNNVFPFIFNAIIMFILLTFQIIKLTKKNTKQIKNT